MLKERLCIACRQKFAACDLLRFAVYNAEEPVTQGNFQAFATIAADFSQSLPGRGAYICQAQVCWQKLLAKRLLCNALKNKVAEADYAALAAYTTAKAVKAQK